MDYENAVAQYLTVDRRISIRPQFEINLPNWTTYPDFLACAENEAYLVEVTTNSNCSHLAKKITEGLIPRLTEIEAALRGEGLIGLTCPLRIWAFVRADQFGKFTKSVEKFGPQVKRTVVELTAFPWFYWSAREKGDEPSFAKLLSTMNCWSSGLT